MRNVTSATATDAVSRFLEAIAHAEAFTETHRLHAGDPPALREACCLAVQYDGMFQPLVPGDRLAGRVRYPLVGFGTENTNGGSLYYCKRTRIRDGARAAGIPEPTGLWDYWRDKVFLDDDLPAGEVLSDGVMLRSLPSRLLADTANSIANMGGRVAGACLDYDRLIRRGLPGLRADIDAADTARTAAGPAGETRTARDGHTPPAALKHDATALYAGMRMGLDSLDRLLSRYADQARALADSGQADDPADMRALAGTLERLRKEPPATFRDGLQLLWLYALASFAVNYGRMDVALGDLLAADLDAGRITEADALALTQALWLLMVERRKAAGEIAEFNARVIVGGLGRRNPENADRFALIAMEASRTVVETEPQLTLRMHRSMNPALIEKAFAVLGEGRVYPMLYNDEVNVLAVMRAFGVTRDEALGYLPYGCGEYAIDHRAIGSPNCSLNLLKALEVALHDGFDPLTGLRPGLATGPIDAFRTFEDLWTAYSRQVEHFILQLGRRHQVEYEVERDMASLNLMSLLFDGTLSSGRSVLDRGTCLTGSIIESFGMVNAADSLNAIRKLVFEQRRMTLDELVAALDNDFAGYGALESQCLAVPAYGNDDTDADGMLARVSRHACEHAMGLAPLLGFDYFLLVNINNWYNVELGRKTGASADGRHRGAPLANGSTPTAGRDNRGVTAMMASLARIPADNHAGYSHNMKFSRSMFQDGGRRARGLIEGYFALGGTQAMLTVVNRDDLEDALAHPERHQNLIVRVGGFSARFIELEKSVQHDILKRTLHD